MPIAFKCGCGRELTLPDHLAGRQAKCPSCGNAFQIPSSQNAAPEKLESDPDGLTLQSADPGLELEAPPPTLPSGPDGPPPLKPASPPPGQWLGPVIKGAVVLGLLALLVLGGKALVGGFERMDFDSHIEAGDDWLKRGYPGDAEEEFRKAQEIFPDDPILEEKFKAVELARAERDERRRLGLPTGPSIHPQVERARALHRQRQKEIQRQIEQIERRMPRGAITRERVPIRRPREKKVDEGATKLSRLKDVQYARVGPWSFAVTDFQTKRKHVKEMPLGSRTLQAEGKARIAMIGIRFKRMREFSSEEEGTLRKHAMWKTISDGRKVFEHPMFIPSSGFMLCWAFQSGGKPHVLVSNCRLMHCGRGLNEVTAYKSDLVLGFAGQHQVEARFGFAWDPSIKNPLLVFSPIPGSNVSHAARLSIKGTELLSVEYSETEALCRKYWPKGLYPRDGRPYQHTSKVEKSERGE